MSTPGQDKRDSLSQKRRREGVVKSDKHCNLTFKPKLGSFSTVLFPRNIIVVFLPVFVVRS